MAGPLIVAQRKGPEITTGGIGYDIRMRFSRFSSRSIPKFALLIGSLALSLCTSFGQQPATFQQPAEPPAKPQHVRPNDAGAATPTRFDMLRGAYGPFRANNDLLYYHLDIRVDPEQNSIPGKNTIRFRMLQDGSRIQLDLNEALNIDKIPFGFRFILNCKSAPFPSDAASN